MHRKDLNGGNRLRGKDPRQVRPEGGEIRGTDGGAGPGQNGTGGGLGGAKIKIVRPQATTGIMSSEAAVEVEGKGVQKKKRV